MRLLITQSVFCVFLRRSRSAFCENITGSPKKSRVGVDGRSGTREAKAPSIFAIYSAEHVNCLSRNQSKCYPCSFTYTRSTSAKTLRRIYVGGLINI